MQKLCELTARTRPNGYIPSDIGSLLEAETPPNSAARMGKVFERIVPAPAAFLHWLIANPNQMNCKDESSFGSRNPEVGDWRRKLLRGTTAERREAQEGGLKALAQTPVEARRGQWWVFEGRS